MMTKQEPHTKLCGQHCISHLLNVDLSTAIQLTGVNGATKSKHLLHLFSAVKRKMGTPQENDLALCKARPVTYTGSNWHWIVWNNGKVYDPCIGTYVDSKVYAEAGMRISSYFLFHVSNTMREYMQSELLHNFTECTALHYSSSLRTDR